MTKELNEKIKELEEKNKALVENLIDAIWKLDVETLKFEFITSSIEKISGYSADEYKNCHIKDRMTLESFQKVVQVITQEKPKFEKGEKNIRTVEIELVHKNGKTYWTELRAKLIREKDSSLKVVGVTREITELKKAKQQQKALIEKLEKALAEKDKLLKEVKTLRGLLPICSGCKRIRDENGKWWPLDAYIRKVTDTELTHTICLDCRDVFYGSN